MNHSYPNASRNASGGIASKKESAGSGLAVAAVVVVDRQHVRALLLEEARQTCGGLLDVRPGEGLRRVIGRLARHPRVVIAEELESIDAQVLRGFELLGDAPLGEGLSG